MADAGWQPDPTGRHEYRYWDGNAWSDQVSNNGEQSTDPVAAPPGGSDTTPAVMKPAEPPRTPAAAPTPAPAAAPITYVPVQQKKRGRGCLITLAVIGGLFILLIIAAVAFGGGDDDEEGASKTAEPKTEIEEVTISACGPPDLIGIVYVEGQARNGSSERSDYIVDVAVIGPDGTQLGTGSTIVQNVEPGQTAIWKALSDTPNERWVEGSTCKVVDVSRNASF